VGEQRGDTTESEAKQTFFSYVSRRLEVDRSQTIILSRPRSFPARLIFIGKSFHRSYFPEERLRKNSLKESMISLRKRI